MCKVRTGVIAEVTFSLLVQLVCGVTWAVCFSLVLHRSVQNREKPPPFSGGPEDHPLTQSCPASSGHASSHQSWPLFTYGPHCVGR